MSISLCEGGYPITAAPCEICGRRPDQSCGRKPPDPRDDEIMSLRAEVARLTKERDQLRIAWELTQQDCHNLTEKVIPNIRAERDQIIEKCAEVCERVFIRDGRADNEVHISEICAAAIRAMKS